jgi:hypothetical protein
MAEEEGGRMREKSDGKKQESRERESSNTGKKVGRPPRLSWLAGWESCTAAGWYRTYSGTAALLISSWCGFSAILRSFARWLLSVASSWPMWLALELPSAGAD